MLEIGNAKLNGLENPLDPEEGTNRDEGVYNI